MKLLSAFLLFFYSFSGWAQHREHGAHVHGAGKLSIAFDKAVGRVEFETPAIAVIGFEHDAKSAKDKKTVSEALSKFEGQIRQMVQMSWRLNCFFKKDKIEVRPDSDGDHSNFFASFDVTCLKSPLGSQLRVDFSKYPGLKEIDVTVLADDLQKNVQVKGAPVEIELKP